MWICGINEKKIKTKNDGYIDFYKQKCKQSLGYKVYFLACMKFYF